MNVEIGPEAPIFLFWEYLFQIFGILSLQCIDLRYVLFRDRPPKNVFFAGILEQSMGVRNQVEIGLLYRPERLHRLAQSIP